MHTFQGGSEINSIDKLWAYGVTNCEPLWNKCVPWYARKFRKKSLKRINHWTVLAKTCANNVPNSGKPNT